MTTLSTGTNDDEATVRCHDCGMTAFSPKEEARANGFCHVKVFDARRRRVAGGNEYQQEGPAGRLEDDGEESCSSIGCLLGSQ